MQINGYDIEWKARSKSVDIYLYGVTCYIYLPRSKIMIAMRASLIGFVFVGAGEITFRNTHMM